MRVILDTNVAISGLLWGGPPNEILKMARLGHLQIVACEQILGELKRALKYRKFQKRLSELKVTDDEVHAYFVNLARFVPSPHEIPNDIRDDSFDNIFLALALENKAHLIVSGDRHLLDLGKYKNVQIVTPSEACDVLDVLLLRTR